jgi:hypothetical protein
MDSLLNPWFQSIASPAHCENNLPPSLHTATSVIGFRIQRRKQKRDSFLLECPVLIMLGVAFSFLFFISWLQYVPCPLSWRPLSGNASPERKKNNQNTVCTVVNRDAPDTVFAGYPAGRISGKGQIPNIFHNVCSAIFRNFYFTTVSWSIPISESEFFYSDSAKTYGFIRIRLHNTTESNVFDFCYRFTIYRYKRRRRRSLNRTIFFLVI